MFIFYNCLVCTVICFYLLNIDHFQSPYFRNCVNFWLLRYFSRSKIVSSWNASIENGSAFLLLPPDVSDVNGMTKRAQSETSSPLISTLSQKQQTDKNNKSTESEKRRNNGGITNISEHGALCHRVLSHGGNWQKDLKQI